MTLSLCLSDLSFCSLLTIHGLAKTWRFLWATPAADLFDFVKDFYFVCFVQKFAI